MPAATAAGTIVPVTSARCAQATSRTAARAVATPASSGSSSWASSRHTVESDATGPNSAR